MGRLLIGLTGTFGSGKTTVAGLFAECGAAIVDADAIARRVVEPGAPALEEIRRVFGEEFILPNGELDRKRMAALVFPSRKQREMLEAIVHPRVCEEMDRQVRSLDAAPAKTGKPRVVVMNIPLLFESNLTHMVRKIVVVTADEAERFRRVRNRDGLSESQVLQRLASQWSQRDKAARADYIIENSGSIESTRAQVRHLYEQLSKDQDA